jgi:hypothetical protein
MSSTEVSCQVQHKTPEGSAKNLTSYPLQAPTKENKVQELGNVLKQKSK